MRSKKISINLSTSFIRIAERKVLLLLKGEGEMLGESSICASPNRIQMVPNQ